MRAISEELQDHLSGEVLTLATCWKMTRRDETVFGFTDHDRDIVMDGLSYEAKAGFTPTAVAASASLNVDNLDVEGLLDSDFITEEDVMAGLYDFAEIEIFQVNYADPDQGKVILRRGWLGEITLRNQRFIAEVRGLTQKLSQPIGALYSAACRADLGDGCCQVDLESFTETGTVDSAPSRNMCLDAARNEAGGYFSGGKITFTSGTNDGLSMEIKEYAPGKLVLALPMPYDIEAGDSYVVVAGCDKTFQTCVQKFDNALNFRGEPHVPGLDRMLETAATRSKWE